MKKEKRKSIATRIGALVIIAVVLSNLITILICTQSAKKQISASVQSNMLGIAESYATTIERAQVDQDGSPLSYGQYNQLLGGVKVRGMESSYIYVVDAEGIMLYHPTKEKVGQPVENQVVKGLVAQLAEGNCPEPDVVEYDYKGVTKYASYQITPRNYILVVSADETDALAGTTRATSVAIAVAVVLVVVFAIVAVVFSKRIARPLNQVSEKLHQVAQGNLSVDFSDMKNSQDEIGRMVSSVKEMTEALNSIVQKIRQTSSTMAKQSSELNITSEQTLEANEEISKAVEDVAEGSTNMATSISDINSNLEHMSNETNTIDTSVFDIRTQALDVQERSAVMNEKMLKMQRSSIKMDEGISYISERIQKVNEVVGKVEEIISVIEGISGQTNLLSLNASIEAARAGEAGRGFAVVAEEIRVLSDNTSSELNRIKSIIAELIRACEECVSASENIVENNREQKEEIGVVLEEFGALDRQIELTADKAEEIKQLVADMVSLNSNITASSDGLTDVSSSNAAATQEVTANIQELNAMMHGVADIAFQMNEHSKQMNDTLDFFR